MTTTVVNIKSGEPYDLYCGRPGILGNEFVIGRHGDRAAVIALHKLRVLSDPIFIEHVVLPNCTDRRLGCYCHPESCHCDLYADICNTIQAMRVSWTASGRAVPDEHKLVALYLDACCLV